MTISSKSIANAERPRLFVGGRWSEPSGGTRADVLNPATSEVAGVAAFAAPSDVDAAVAAASASFASGVWSRAAPAERARVLRAAADILEAHLDELAHLMTSEMGVLLSYAQRVHIPNPIRTLRYYADYAEKFEYEEHRHDGTNGSLVSREPVGVVGAVTPWNGPLSNPVMKLAPALASGCSVVLKPAPDTPLSAYALAEALAWAGLPEGVLSVVPGGRDIGELVVTDPRVDKVAFTGSTAVGRRVMALCAERVARVTLELGGKSAAIVLPDADLGQLVPGLLPMSFMLSGQACIAQTRVLVPSAREAEVVEALAAAYSAQRVGDPLDPGTDLGPLINEAQRDRVESYVETGKAEGARVVVGGRRPVFGSTLDNGWFAAPTLLAGVRNSMRVASEEIFGPVVSVITYGSEEEAVAMANDSVYGLSGSVWSADAERALAVARRIRTGMVSVNGHPQAFGSPLGGFKQSGLGRELGPEGFAAYLEPRSIAVGPAA
ncbi:aldehyde dehydrogenase [Amycolatopsis acidicola]|uniref:aldehyde dehydrogenase (NAD(+)) n=1 Tax=Amycolatopsis acidicola TaxID=2596893 RepID=A0A5N0VDT3_9PSEU|nr:aldehyde dehydrogenase [Amycolatopsis acidicola]KAA9164456.1 aldehyde dehydrogenase [Amycolatopsis acidicola]